MYIVCVHAPLLLVKHSSFQALIPSFLFFPYLLRACSIGTIRVELSWLGFFTCSVGNQPFSVGLVDQLFQPTRKQVELVENNGYRPLSQSWAHKVNKRHLA